MVIFTQSHQQQGHHGFCQVRYVPVDPGTTLLFKNVVLNLSLPLNLILTITYS